MRTLALLALLGAVAVAAGLRRRPGLTLIDGSPATHPPLESLQSNLSRLSAEIDRLDRTNPMAKVAKMRATALAYDGLLLDACRVLELPSPGAAPLRPDQRMEAELELTRAGLRW